MARAASDWHNDFAADAVMTYYPNAPDGSWLETCTSPGSDKAECTASLNTFIAWFGDIRGR